MAVDDIPSTLKPEVIVSTAAEPIAPGKFRPTWESLAQYRAPEWFRDAKFGIWAHWGPQCEPEQGDWFGKRMCWQYNKQRDGSRVPNPRYVCFTQNVGPISGFRQKP